MKHFMPRRLVLAALAGLVVTPAGLVAQNGNASSPAPDSSARATAIQASSPPAIDGREDDDVWRRAPATSDFREFQPTEGKAPRFRTEFKAAYDERNLYIFVRAFDPSPDSIMRDLSRRDVRGSSDQLKVMIDSYFDRRNGFEFAVNPVGVKRDFAMYNDRDEDGSWDGVWDVGTRIDSVGWTAEFRIPFSQLRYANAPSHTFGFAIWRDIERYKERTSWPLYSSKVNGLVSQLGRLEGIEGISAPRQLEITPYTLTKNVSRQTGAASWDRVQHATAGADIKYGITPNLTLDATINPDFGQVEADPAVVNLTAFETRFQERRPFFVEGTGLYQFAVNCNVVNCGGEGLFYSRRVGRSPQLRGAYGGAGSPLATPILAASKLTGRFPGGLSIGVLEALTPRVEGTLDRTIEPLTSYTVARVQQEFRGGGTTVGAIGTGVHRSLDQWTTPSLRQSAYVGGADFRHKLGAGDYEVGGKVMFSHIAGDTAVINATQLESAHYFQRPGATHLSYDPLATSLTGHAQELTFGKFGGGITRFETSYQRRSPGFEINDLGFMRRADEQQQATWFALQYRTPTDFYRSLQMNFNQWNLWNTGGLKTETGFNTNWHLNDNNNWWWHVGATLNQLGSFCDNCTRGGPAIRRSPMLQPWFGFEVDDRQTVAPFFFVNLGRGDYGASRYAGFSPGVNIRPSGAVQVSVGADYSTTTDDSQFFGNFSDGTGTHYSFAHLEQKVYAFNTRVSYTMTPNLTLQVYAQPFLAKGDYSDVRELSATPRADRYEDRYQPYAPPAGTPMGFNSKSLRSNTVLRWEFRPGSTLFAVWTHGRDDYATTAGARSLGQEYDHLFELHPDNTFLVKIAYWLNR